MKRKSSIGMKNRWRTLMIHLLNRILILKLSGLSIQCIQQKIASQRSFHTINVITLGTTSNTTTPLRNRGRVLHQTVCHWLALMPLMQRPQSTQLKTASRKFSHITSVTTLGMMSNTTTPLRSHGRPPRQMECH